MSGQREAKQRSRSRPRRGWREEASAANPGTALAPSSFLKKASIPGAGIRSAIARQALALQASRGNRFVQQTVATGNSLNRFPIDVSTATRAHFNLLYKVFERGQSSPVSTGRFTGAGERISVQLEKGKNYTVQVVGNVLVRQDKEGVVLRDHTDIRVDWPVIVDNTGNITVMPTAVNSTPEAQNSDWLLQAVSSEFGAEGLGSLSLNLTLSDTTVINRTEVQSRGQTDTIEVGEGISYAAGQTQERAEGVERSRARPIPRSFGLFLDLAVPSDNEREDFGPMQFVAWHREGDTVLGRQQRDVLISFAESLTPEIRRRIRSGQLPVYVEGHASATGSETRNEDLFSRQRAMNVAGFLRGILGSAANIITSHEGSRRNLDKVAIITVGEPPL